MELIEEIKAVEELVDVNCRLYVAVIGASVLVVVFFMEVEMSFSRSEDIR